MNRTAVARGPQDAEVSGRFEPLGEQAAIDAGGRRRFWECRSGNSGATGIVMKRTGSTACATGGLASRRRSGCRVARRSWMLELYGGPYRGWNVKHFHEHLVSDHGFRWGYTWVKTQLHSAGLVERARAARGASAQARAQAFEGMMLHRTARARPGLRGSDARSDRHMDDATSTIYSAFLVEEEGTPRRCGRCSKCSAPRLAGKPLHRPRQLLFLHPQADGPVDKKPADPGRPGAQAFGNRAHPGLFAGGARALGAHVRHLAGPPDQGARQGRDRRHRRPPTRLSATFYLPAHNARFARPAALPRAPSSPPMRRCWPRRCASRRSAWSVATIPSPMTARGCNCPPARRAPITSRPRSRCANIPTARWPCFTVRGASPATAPPARIAAAPTAASVTPCSPPSRRGLQPSALAAPPQPRPALTAPARGVTRKPQVGTEKRPSDRTKKPTRKATATVTASA